MRIAGMLLIGVMVLLAAGCGRGKVGDAVRGLWEAIENRDGATAVSYLSQSAIDKMAEQLEVFKRDPRAAAQQMSAMGMPVTPEEIQSMTPRLYAEKIISSDMMMEQLRAARLTVRNVVVDGDTAMVTVELRAAGGTQTNTIPVIWEDDAWKVTEFLVSQDQ